MIPETAMAMKMQTDVLSDTSRGIAPPPCLQPKLECSDLHTTFERYKSFFVGKAIARVCSSYSGSEGICRICWLKKVKVGKVKATEDR